MTLFEKLYSERENINVFLNVSGIECNFVEIMELLVGIDLNDDESIILLSMLLS